MTSVLCEAFLKVRWQPAIQFVRNRNKPNIQRPRAPHYQRALVLHVCKPMYKKEKESLTMQELCKKPVEILEKKQVEVHPYRTLLKKEILNWFNNSKMVMFLHSNPISGQDFFKARVLFKRKNMILRDYEKKLVKEALERTRYEVIQHLFSCPCSMVFATETDVASVLKIIKKTPQYTLLAGIIDDQLLSKNQLVEYSELPDLQTAQSHLVCTLNSVAQNLIQDLNHHQNTLTSSLSSYIEIKTPKGENK